MTASTWSKSVARAIEKVLVARYGNRWQACFPQEVQRALEAAEILNVILVQAMEKYEPAVTMAREIRAGLDAIQGRASEEAELRREVSGLESKLEAAVDKDSYDGVHKHRAYVFEVNLQGRRKVLDIQEFKTVPEALACWKQHGYPVPKNIETYDTEFAMAVLAAERAKSGMTTHCLYLGAPLCRFSEDVPANWPQGHRWVSKEHREEITCGDCKSLLGEVS